MTTWSKEKHIIIRSTVFFMHVSKVVQSFKHKPYRRTSLTFEWASKGSKTHWFNEIMRYVREGGIDDRHHALFFFLTWSMLCEKEEQGWLEDYRILRVAPTALAIGCTLFFHAFQCFFLHTLVGTPSLLLRSLFLFSSRWNFSRSFVVHEMANGHPHIIALFRCRKGLSERESHNILHTP